MPATVPAEQALDVTSKDGTRVALFRSGNGPPLVLVHGTTADHGRWRPVWPALAERHTVFAMDRRGRGGSGDGGADGRRPYSIEREFEDVAAAVGAAHEATGQPVDLLGHSYGGLCALEAARRTSRLRRLVLYEPAMPLGKPLYAPATLADIERRLAAGDRDGALEVFMGKVAGVPAPQLALLRSLPAWAARVQAAHTIVRECRVEETYRFDAHAFETVRTPTLLLLGGDSPAIFKDATEAVARALPDARVVVLPGQQHAAIDTGTQLFLDAVTTFLRP